MRVESDRKIWSFLRPPHLFICHEPLQRWFKPSHGAQSQRGSDTRCQNVTAVWVQTWATSVCVTVLLPNPLYCHSYLPNFWTFYDMESVVVWFLVRSNLPAHTFLSSPWKQIYFQFHWASNRQDAFLLEIGWTDPSAQVYIVGWIQLFALVMIWTHICT